MFSYNWNIKDGYPSNGVEKHGKTVFSCFACGGGSTMGYKLAGYEVIGNNEIDPRMMSVYRKNHHPKFSYLCDIRELIKKEDLPEELFNLDVLDGSPPCSVFSTAGQREKGWNKEKVFREGQRKQKLDDLFFYFIELAKKLQPKVVISENVSGLLKGNAKGYVKKIVEEFSNAGYITQIFLLNGATMGLPQKRERCFFISQRKDIYKKNIKLSFNDKLVPFGVCSDDEDKSNTLTPLFEKYWEEAKSGDAVGTFNSVRKCKLNDACNTITASDNVYHPKYKRKLNKKELCLVGSYPLDYDFGDETPCYLIGMSVPPLMMAKISYQVYNQILKEEK